jgi:hypothetical protein
MRDARRAGRHAAPAAVTSSSAPADRCQRFAENHADHRSALRARNQLTRPRTPAVPPSDIDAHAFEPLRRQPANLNARQGVKWHVAPDRLDVFGLAQTLQRGLAALRVLTNARAARIHR